MTSDSADRTSSEHGRHAPEPASPDDATARPQDATAQGEGAAARQQPEQREEFGPLELLRTRKADGRALLLFSHRREQADR